MSTDTNQPSTTVSPANVAVMFFDRVGKSADREAFRKLDRDRWVSLTWREAAKQVEALAAGLLALGIQPEQRVAIASSTR
ncbi:AMP-binding protein, partial [Mycolicibacterium novocastrense]